ncbi:MAG: HD domain-containing protein [Flavobacteriaceae bacterium]|nr:HD domain-containing protein [Flavobacteriaceae bacterium]
MSADKNETLITATTAFVKAQLCDAEGGHDWFHVERVYNNAMRIANHENVDHTIVALAVLLHDIADPKFHDGDESIGPRKAREFLTRQEVDTDTIEHVINIIEHMSFKNSLEKGTSFESPELFVVRDADRLDAIGAIGIARCFNFGGFKNRAIYDPEISAKTEMTKTEYKNSNAPSINHFYEKLLLLKDEMHTETARRMAEDRHRFMQVYLDQFYAEWDGKR